MPQPILRFGGRGIPRPGGRPHQELAWDCTLPPCMLAFGSGSPSGFCPSARGQITHCAVRPWPPPRLRAWWPCERHFSLSVMHSLYARGLVGLDYYYRAACPNQRWPRKCGLGSDIFLWGSDASQSVLVSTRGICAQCMLGCVRSQRLSGGHALAGATCCCLAAARSRMSQTSGRTIVVGGL